MAAFFRDAATKQSERCSCLPSFPWFASVRNWPRKDTKVTNEAEAGPWGRHSCLPVRETFQSPDGGERCWVRTLESVPNRQAGKPAPHIKSHGLAHSTLRRDNARTQ